MGFFYDTFLDRWPESLAALSIPTVQRRLTDEDVVALLSQCPQTRERIGAARRMRFSSGLMEWISMHLPAFPDGAFPRLSPCSFVTRERGPSRVLTGEAIAALLAHPGRRAAALVHRCFTGREHVSLCLRQWREIPPASEFRIFVENRKVLAASQYHWRCVFPDLEARAEALAAIVAQAARRIAACAHLKDLVADIYIDASATDSWVLMELNPYAGVTDACLFSWTGEQRFDGTLRYRATDGSTRALVLTSDIR